MIRVVLTLWLSFFAALPLRAAVDIQQVTSPGGIDAWLVESHDIPFLALEIRFRGGASLDAPGKRGAINLMTALLEEGSGEMDARAFAAARDALAADISFDVGDDTMSVSVRALTENREEAMALVRQALETPRFDPDAVERVRNQVLSLIRSDEKDPDAIAARTFDQLAFGDHPYGSPLNGTADSVAALVRDDLIDAKARVMARDRLVVSAVGDITAAELGELLDELLGWLPDTGAPMPEKVPFGLKGGVTVVPFDTPQSVAMFGQRGLDRDDPDFLTAYVLNEVLGAGGFTSRLMTEVREKRGLTYGVASYLYPMDSSAMLLGQVASANNRVAEAIEVIRAEWVKAATEGITEDELEAVKTYLTGAYALRFDGNGQIARILMGMQLDGLTPDYITERNDMIRALTIEDIRRVAAELLDPEGLHFVVVGQPEGLQSTN